jgi:tetratricopeptide (TPR) repeat protein
VERVELFELLADAVERNAGELAGLCVAHAADIRAAFASWQKVPEANRNDPKRVARHANTLIAVARQFAQANDPSLLARLSGAAQTNPIVRWQAGFRQASALSSQGRHREALAMLDAMIAELRTMKGTAVAEYLPKALGHRGAALFHVGELQAALAANSEALQLCEEQGDAEGVLAYTGSHAVILKRVGQLTEARAAFAEYAVLLERAGRRDEAVRIRANEGIGAPDVA